MIKKANRKWHMCIDCLDLNKTWPKDSFSLLWIDQPIDGTVVNWLLSFMNAYTGNNQIEMHV